MSVLEGEHRLSCAGTLTGRTRMGQPCVARPACRWPAVAVDTSDDEQLSCRKFTAPPSLAAQFAAFRASHMHSRFYALPAAQTGPSGVHVARPSLCFRGFMRAAGINSGMGCV
jgi:hypothetical protein